jgi:hypothetical protein
VPSARVAKKAIWLSGIAITLILSVVAYAGRLDIFRRFMCLRLVLSTGLVIYTRYEHCDPISKGLVASKDQLLPMFALDLTANGFLTTGFSG